MRRSLAMALLLLVAAALPARAQFPAEVRGRVTDRATGAADVIAAEGLEYRSVLGLADLGL